MCRPAALATSWRNAQPAYPAIPRPVAAAAEMSDLPQAPSALDYARGIHTEAHNSNKDLYTRAQVVLTLDGIVVAAAAAGLAGQSDDLKKAVAVFGATTWVFVGVAAFALIASVMCSTMALASLHQQGRVNDAAAYKPTTMWYYARIAELVREPRDRVRFIEIAEQADALFETKARLEQVAIMAPLMVKRANWLNAAFGFAALTFVAFALASADYVIRLAT